jgi:hypothetical protein
VSRMPGFTAEDSIGIFAQDYHLARNGNDIIGIIPTLDFGIYSTKCCEGLGGCCCKGIVCGCPHPCSGWVEVVDGERVCKCRPQ